MLRQASRSQSRSSERVELPPYYCVSIISGSSAMAGGFLLAPRFVLTADHCLRRTRHEVGVELRLNVGGREVQAKVVERLPDYDLALLELDAEAAVDWDAVPAGDVPIAGDHWLAPYRPTLGDPLLVGDIGAPSLDYQCESGCVVQAMQLQTDADLGDYSGYSGGPVERRSDKRRLLGMIFEQYPDRQDSKRSTKVLFALTLAEAYKRLTQLGVARHFMALTSPSACETRQGGSGNVSEVHDHATQEMLRRIDMSEHLFPYIDRLEAMGLLSPMAAQQKRARVMNSVFKSAGVDDDRA